MGALGRGGNTEEVQISEGKGAPSVLAVEFEAISSYPPYSQCQASYSLIILFFLAHSNT